MASDKSYLNFILEGYEGLSARAMMGEYLLYYNGKLVGGIYDNRLLIKPVPSAIALMPNAEYQAPYTGAKEMLFVDNVEDKEFLQKLFVATYEELQNGRK